MNGYPENHVYSIFTGLSVKQFDGIYKEIESKYTKYEVKRLSSNRIYRIRERKRDVGAGRHFKLDVKNRFVMVLVYYRLYITYTLTGFLFGLDQSNVCRDIHNIEALIRSLPIPQKIYNITKRLNTTKRRKLRNIFPALWHL